MCNFSNFSKWKCWLRQSRREDFLIQKLQYVAFWMFRRLSMEGFLIAQNIQLCNLFFIVFQFFIDFRKYISWSMQILILVLFWSTGLWLEKEDIAFFFGKYKCYRRRKVVVEGSLAFQTCHHFFWILLNLVWLFELILESCRRSLEGEVL